ncbi:molybdenum cofactor guanylyltransferase [Haladaptatus halobius]|uniref:molybdenum cofactor guanylyltransferase n=1 Tax=Haladaptatus halobius TaxID=2884875 RepID=UPI001D0BA4D5|nr:molybdenum cofactor guanylyltransferase [Haladaptatus halobius]
MTESIETALDVTGLVLAGGQSSRFGDADVNQAVATFDNHTLIGRVVDIVTEAMDQPLVAAIRTADQRKTYADVLSDRDITFVFDDEAFEGLLASVFGAVDTVDTSWVFSCGCDMPLLSPAVIQWLVNKLQDSVHTSNTPPAALAVRHPDGTIDPLHALYRQSAIKRVHKQLPSAAGPRMLLASLEEVVAVPVDAAPVNLLTKESMTNINTRDEPETASCCPTSSR